MAKKNDLKSDIIETEDNNKGNYMGSVVENIPVSNPVLYEFDQAFRIYLKDNISAKSWTIEAVKVFCKKRLGASVASLENWFSVLNKY